MCRVEFSKIGKRDVTFIREMRVGQDHYISLEEYLDEPESEEYTEIIFHVLMNGL